MKTKCGTINLPIARKENSIIKRCIDENGYKAITHYQVLFQGNTNDKQISVVKCVLETGRTHQIRVHMKAIGHLLLSDTLYGTSSCLINRQALHSYKVSFYHPIDKSFREYTASIPDDFNKILKICKEIR